MTTGPDASRGSSAWHKNTGLLKVFYLLCYAPRSLLIYLPWVFRLYARAVRLSYVSRPGRTLINLPVPHFNHGDENKGATRAMSSDRTRLSASARRHPQRQRKGNPDDIGSGATRSCGERQRPPAPSPAFRLRRTTMRPCPLRCRSERAANPA